MSNHILYLFPGMGADKRLFAQQMSLPFDLRVIEWDHNTAASSIKDYAQGLVSQIDTSQSYSLLGISMGGLVAIELAKLLSPNKVIIIASVKTSNEMPGIMKTGLTRLMGSIIPGWCFKKFHWLIEPFFGKMTKQVLKVFRQMLYDNPTRFLKWSIKATLDWDNTEVLPNLVHIHGSKDRIFPIKNIRDAYIIDDGTHLINMLKGEEVNQIIIKECNN